MTRPRVLTESDHDRGSMERRYVYAVVSRRARGVSIGVNLNPNNACNWRCIYCQVPDLRRGKGPAIELTLLRDELEATLDEVLDGDFMEQRVPEGSRVLRDVAFSGNGEPTTSPSFAGAVDVVLAALRAREGLAEVGVTLITNGTMLGQQDVLAAVRRMGSAGGEVWFKLDAATAAAAARVNGQPLDIERHVERLLATGAACRTWIQTCMFALDGAPPPELELSAYVARMQQLVARAAPVRGVLLYSLARPSLQPEGPRLSPLPSAWLEAFAARVEAVGMPVRIHA